MKHLLTALFLFLFLIESNSQTVINTDSLAGFPEVSIRQDLKGQQISSSEIESHIKHLKKQFVRQKFFPSAIQLSQKNQQQQVNAAPCVNENFELSGNGPFTTGSSVPGWSLSNNFYGVSCSFTSPWASGSSNFTIANTPLFGLQGIGTLTQSPLGGNRVAVLNNTVTNDYSVTRLTQTFPVTASNSFFNYAVAAILSGDDSHFCCESSGYQILFYDCSNNFLCSKSFSLSSCASQSPALSTISSSITGTFRFHNWQTHSVDLSAYINSCVRVEVIANDCSYGGHYGMVYFDAECGSAPIASNIGNPIISFCPGAPFATIQAPPGYPTYTWTVPSPYFITAAQATSAVLGFLNPSTGGVFTLNLGTNLNCAASQTFALVNSSVSISETNTLLSCNPGSTGGATVFPMGSANGYTYTWTNSTSSVVGTGSVLSNVPPGVYNVSVSATAGCGVATTSVTVPAFTSSFTLFGPSVYTMCPNTSIMVQATQTAVTGNSATMSWTPSTFLSITNASFTFVNPQSTPGTSLSITYSVTQTPSALICPYTRTFTVNYFEPPTPQISMVSDVCLNSGTFQVVATPTGGVFYSDAQINSASGIITPSLSSVGTKTIDYVVSSSVCTNTASTSFIVKGLPTVPTQTLINICAGKTATLNLIGNNVYSWNGISGNSLVVIANTNTTAVAGATNLVSGCSNSAIVTINALPNPSLVVSSNASVCAGDVFSVSVAGANTYTWQSGFTQTLTSNTATVGLNSFSVSGTYTSTGCKSSAIHTLMAIAYPTLSVSGNSIVCKGEVISLSASGADAYTWTGAVNSGSYTTTLDSIMHIRLIGTNSNLCSDTIMLTLTPNACLGVTENNVLKESIFPNPASTKLFVQATTSQTLAIYEISGKLLLTAKLVEGLNTISVSDFAQGVYLVKLSDGSFTRVTRLLIGGE